MKKTFAEKHPYIAVILSSMFCTFMTALGMAVTQIMGLTGESVYNVATIALLVSVAIGFLIMKRSKFKLSEYGFRMSEKGSRRKIWWYAPLIAIEVIPIAVYGFSKDVMLLQFITAGIFTITVGFNEEIYFRGIALRFLMGKGQKKAIIVSSVIFGLLHLANALNGKDMLYLVLQMLFAFLVGLVLAEIVSIGKSLWPAIVWHAAHDFISIATGESLDRAALIILAIQVAILLIYAVGIWKKSENRRETSHNLPENP